jgi:hypothetical protein
MTVLKATGDRRGTFEIRQNGELLTTLQKELRFQLAGKEYGIRRNDAIKPIYSLHHDDAVLATAEHTSILRSSFHIAHAGRTWAMKPEGFISRVAGLYDDESTKVGSFIPKSYFFPNKEIAIDLPPEIALEAQVFLLWVFLRMLEARSGD